MAIQAYNVITPLPTIKRKGEEQCEVMQSTNEEGDKGYIRHLSSPSRLSEHPTEKIHSSLARRLFGRRTKTQLPMSKKLLIPETVPPGEVKGNLHKSKKSQAKFYDQKAKSLSPIKPRNTVGMKRPGEI